MLENEEESVMHCDSPPDLEMLVLTGITEKSLPAARNLEGKLLTLADASIGDERQLKAFKDMLKSIVWSGEVTRQESIEGWLYANLQKTIARQYKMSHPEGIVEPTDVPLESKQAR